MLSFSNLNPNMKWIELISYLRKQACALTLAVRTWHSILVPCIQEEMIIVKIQMRFYAG